jgi:pyrimidine operon attenuation protein/uracil phosphoribosyltransferase
MTATAARRVLARSDEIARIVARLAHEIVEPNQAQEGLVVLGVRRGGEALAVRLAAEIERISGSRPALGFLNINLYRDDRVTHELPDSQIPVDVSGRVVIVVDDVLYTGRTIRSALDAVTDLGRPAAIRLCVLVDRGLRELPIQPDYVGRFTPTSPSQRVEVALSPAVSASDEVTILGYADADPP